MGNNINSSLIGLNFASANLAAAVSSVDKKAEEITKGIDKFEFISDFSAQKVVPVLGDSFAEKYSNLEPEMLFVAEYVVDDNNIGVLIVWEKLPGSTHYELFKKNVFQNDPKFERILFLDVKSIEEETSNYTEYLKDVIGVGIDENNICVVLDTSIKEDRIYEYKIRAARVPSVPREVEYEYIMKSKNLLKYVTIDETTSSDLFSFTGAILGSNDLAWSVALLNKGIPFFGRSAIEKPINSFSIGRSKEGDRFIFVSENVGDILLIINDSISLFSIKPTFNRLLLSLGGISEDFRNSFLDSIDEPSQEFSFDTFRNSVKSKFPIFNMVLQISNSANIQAKQELSTLSIVVPLDVGSVSLRSIDDVTKVLIFVKKFIIAVLYSQDNSVKIEEIIQTLQASEASTSGTTVQQTSLAAAIDALTNSPNSEPAPTPGVIVQPSLLVGKSKI
jgi:hypothetical protein